MSSSRRLLSGALGLVAGSLSFSSKALVAASACFLISLSDCAAAAALTGSGRPTSSVSLSTAPMNGTLGSSGAWSF